MNLNEHYAALLGLGDEWSVSDVSLDLERRRLDIRPNRLVSIARTWPSTPEELESVLDFYPEEWQLVRVEVRWDTGKFVRSTWRINGVCPLSGFA